MNVGLTKSCLKVLVKIKLDRQLTSIFFWTRLEHIYHNASPVLNFFEFMFMQKFITLVKIQLSMGCGQI